MLRFLHNLRRGTEGFSLIEVALLLPVLLLLMVGIIDITKGYYAAIEVDGAATAGAEYWQVVPSNPGGIPGAAAADAADVVGMTTTYTTGCECADGTNQTPNCTSTPSCSDQVVSYVTVNTSMTYTPTINFPGLPRSYAINGSATERANF